MLRKIIWVNFDFSSHSEMNLGIEPLLEVDDIVDSERPDERSVMTYISEFFHKFSNQDQREVAARRIQKLIRFQQSIEDSQNNYVASAQDVTNIALKPC
jgi:hypothetical protein